MTKEEKKETEGLKPLGVRRLRELRRENEELRTMVESQAGRIKALERALQKVQERECHDLAIRAPPAEDTAPADSGEAQPAEPEVETEVQPTGPEAEREVQPAGPETEVQPTGPEAEAPDPGEDVAAAPRGGKRIIRDAETVHRRIVRVAGNAAFYLAVMLGLMGAVFTRAARGGAPLSIAGYSGMLVLSESMQDVIPKGSFILTKWVEPELLAVGDDITYMMNPTTSVTHRITDIKPQIDGSLSFQTQGVNNTSPDSSLVLQENIVGKVIYHSLLLGLVAQGISDNWPLLLFLLGVWTALGWALHRILREDRYQGKHLVCGPD